MSKTDWKTCTDHLERELPADDFNTWIRPLQIRSGKSRTVLQAPNEYVRDYITLNHLERIRDIFEHLGESRDSVTVDVSRQEAAKPVRRNDNAERRPPIKTGLDRRYRFKNFVQGKSNELAYAAALQVAKKPGTAYNPLVIYGSTGLGKTHLMQAIGNAVLDGSPNLRVRYVSCESFINDFIKAIRFNKGLEFKNDYRSVDVLMIDDIQFLAGKERTQEQFFHTFNALLEGGQQMILTCDRYPKEVVGLEERLKSRFGWGLTVSIEPPDFETRVAILMNKAQEKGVQLEEPVAFLVARHLQSNVRDLEGALNIMIANARFTGQDITENFTRARRFLAEVDSSSVMVNASTRFNDGGQLGLGTEIGISTTKLHSYGPMGLEELTTRKFVVYGTGQVRY